MMRRLYLPMAPVPFTTGLVLALFLVPGLATAGSPLSGTYRADPYGTLELKTEGEHVSGRMVQAGACHFDAEREVLQGNFEGSVLVARLTVCQSGGATCPQEQTYTVLGFYDEEDRTLVAHVRVQEGCQSAGLLKSGRFVLAPASATGSSEPPTGGSGAQDSAGKRASRTVDAARQASQRGEQFYQENKFAEAANQFKQSLEFDSGDSNWPAYLGRGSSLLKMGQMNLAIKDLERARNANPQNGFILYMLGCAYAQKRDKPKALDYLKRAVNAGYELHVMAEHDQDLTRALGSDPQFRELVKSSREKNSHGPASSGTSSP